MALGSPTQLAHAQVQDKVFLDLVKGKGGNNFRSDEVNIKIMLADFGPIIGLFQSGIVSGNITFFNLLAGVGYGRLTARRIFRFLSV